MTIFWLRPQPTRLCAWLQLPSGCRVRLSWICSDLSGFVQIWLDLTRFALIMWMCLNGWYWSEWPMEVTVHLHCNLLSSYSEQLPGTYSEHAWQLHVNYVISCELLYDYLRLDITQVPSITDIHVQVYIFWQASHDCQSLVVSLWLPTYVSSIYFPASQSVTVLALWDHPVLFYSILQQVLSLQSHKGGLLHWLLCAVLSYCIIFVIRSKHRTVSATPL